MQSHQDTMMQQAFKSCTQESPVKHSFRKLILLLAIIAPTTLATAAEPFVVSPADIRLGGNFERTQLVITQADKSGKTSDTTSGIP